MDNSAEKQGRRAETIDIDQPRTQIHDRTAQLEAYGGDLRRSNENLRQFAYIPSHDLQEPLRKIQQFGDLLKSQYAQGLGTGVACLERMQTTADHISTLIGDLLTYSRIAIPQDTTAPVLLTAKQRSG